jgi:hypothetical protein
MREDADAFVAYAGDPDPRVRRAAIEGLGLFLDDAERAVALLRDRLVGESGVVERLQVVRTMADLALRLPAAAAPVRTWFDGLADSSTTDPDTRLAALVHRARCALGPLTTRRASPTRRSGLAPAPWSRGPHSRRPCVVQRGRLPSWPTGWISWRVGIGWWSRGG